MSKNLLGMVTFGNINFTKLAVETIEQYTESPLDFFFVIGKPGDSETENFIKSKGFPYKYHPENYGFPAGLNDIYDHAWVENDYDNLLIAGNDIAVYPNTVDSLINYANESDWDWISSSQFDVKSLVNLYPQQNKYFEGGNLIFNSWGERPWEIHEDYNREHAVEPNVIKDVHNLCLYKRTVKDAIGYIDVGFYPAYYSDNDYARRGVNAELKTCALSNSVYFHFWSRTIHQGSGGSTGRFFENNRRFYKMKWGGDFAHEAWKLPFNGRDYQLTANIVLPGTLNINSRENEAEIIKFWRGR